MRASFRARSARAAREAAKQSVQVTASATLRFCKKSCSEIDGSLTSGDEGARVATSPKRQAEVISFLDAQPK
jgi:hypothetical protein